MSLVAPSQEWWTADEIAASGLPDVPATKRGVNQMAERHHWRAQPGLARRRKGRGGGWEYSWRLLPARAQRKLLTGAAVAAQPERQGRDDAWRWFEAQPEHRQKKARDRLQILQEVEALEPAIGRDRAVSDIARHRKIGARTIWTWFALIEGVRPDDRLAYLAPRQGGGDGPVRDCSPEFFDFVKSDFLRTAQPSFSSCYRRAERVAAREGWDTVPERTLRRWFDAQVSKPTQVLCRKGVDALKTMFPPQVRDKTCLVAMEAVTGDFHKFDVWVNWPKINHPVRPQMVAFQDIYSGRILAWRIDLSANSTAVQLAAGDMIETWGIPEHVLLDNGREFAAKAITGKASTRYRFKPKEDDIPGLFTALGCEIHWSTPYSGQSKPIERAFRDMCDTISRDPRFDGAWTGNRPDAKPEDYGSRAIDLDEFIKVVAEGIDEHNTRQGRRSEVAFGRSFADVFDESYATAPIRKATEAQRRLWLLGAKGVRADRNTGEIRFAENRFWADWMHEISGQRVVIRFDLADFWAGLHVYSADNAYLGHAPCIHKVGFFDADEARNFARVRNEYQASVKKAAAAHRRLTAAELGGALDGASLGNPVTPEAKVIKPTFGKKASRDGQAPREAQAATVADLGSRRPQPVEAEETARARFGRALELERQTERGEGITPDQQRWLNAYQTTPEYRAERMLWEDMGDGIFG
ncbi:transposase domain-containing protein [Acidimangrovimonas sediminis]|uniref:transposase domain-containing protein n=1 Tax=Acidimangrovimonas sediminis TaxID=2056283 RepID=UPI000C7FA31A|nr:transposase domain-containing protein [Acidimangrovimonas sediminis]